MSTLRDLLAKRDRVLPYLDWKLRRLTWPAYLGLRYHCPVCAGRFRSWASSRTSPSRPVQWIRCPRCDALPRMRALWLYLDRVIERDARVLHVSPEVGVERRLRERCPSYTTVDLYRRDVDVRASLTELPFGDGAFDLVLCCDVLEHIEDDRAALRELHRVVAPGGEVLIRVPLRGEKTLEDPSAKDPAERDRLFGQPDHVRFYGLDIVDRLTAAGFDCETLVLPRDLAASPRAAECQGLGGDHVYFRCRRAPVEGFVTDG